MNARDARPEHGDRRPVAETQRIPAARTERLPIPPTGTSSTEQMRCSPRPAGSAVDQPPASRTEKLPETRPDSTTTPMRQVRRLAEDGPWPAIPMLPVIKPEDVPLSEVDRVRENRGVAALQRYLEWDQRRGPDEPAWPERDHPDA
ncbi:hypothetical protein EV383_4528 [Pseudonocardia sediminis]|uniref:Uncharacterized protein n=1 Tax=Pseudonocardia sediminis TaxID=1397368 RepID=A0A4Q7UZM6_PSEST|nr:hypothetical protein [Pseudonocardia sediminis]RZT87602.1 hypothetical protein EV383_4528 [Pseudonocardia sediminis]